MGRRKWRLVWSVNFALHAEPTKLWRHNDLIYAQRLWQQLSVVPSETSQWSMPALQHNTAHTCTDHNGNNGRRTFVFLTQTFGKWYECHFIERGNESPHKMHLENRDLKIWNSCSKVIWGYTEKVVIKMEISPHHFLCVAPSLTEVEMTQRCSIVINLNHEVLVECIAGP